MSSFRDAAGSFPPHRDQEYPGIANCEHLPMLAKLADPAHAILR